MVPLSQLFQFTEISSSINQEYIKFYPAIKNSAQVMLLKLLVGMLEMVKIVGWLRIVGVKIGEKME